MNLDKAVVLEKKGSIVTVLTSDGSFQKVRYQGFAEIGSEIDLSSPEALSGPFLKLRNHAQLRRLASIAAVFLLIFLGTMGWNLYQASTAAAMISMDINPSLQLTLNRQGKVLRSEAFNADAQTVLSGLQIKGDSWQEAVSEVVDKSIELNYLNAAHSMILVGYAPVKDTNAEIEGLNTSGLTKQITDSVANNTFKSQVVVYTLTNNELSKANQEGLTPGEYGLMVSAQKAGVSATPNMVKESDKRKQIFQQLQGKNQMENDISKSTNESINEPVNQSPNEDSSRAAQKPENMSTNKPENETSNGSANKPGNTSIENKGDSGSMRGQENEHSSNEIERNNRSNNSEGPQQGNSTMSQAQPAFNSNNNLQNEQETPSVNQNRSDTKSDFDDQNEEHGKNGVK